MIRSSQAGVSGATGNRSASRTLCALILLVAFVVQLARVFVAMETCAHHRSTGYTLQHCKDAVEGIVPTVVLAEIIPSAVALPTLEPRWGNSPHRLAIREDAPLSPLFHPPRKSS